VTVPWRDVFALLLAAAIIVAVGAMLA